MTDKPRLVVGLTKDVVKDLKSLSGKERKWVLATVKRLESDYDALKDGGKIEPLEDKKGKNGIKLGGLYKLKNAGMGVRIVLDISDDGLNINVVSISGETLESEAELYGTVIAVGVRKEEQVYKAAEKRINKIRRNQSDK